ncbi:hypothetical protein VHA01S_030_00240 [Vibrio halioticoli NBRC 102217]|uniref:Thioredoxin-like fold domain-containing protein n=1 Tax=Vibrio halioticoli NBRC 102217 TaxID=1219072 RepID=V5F419_9VIBR|nr:hypothetical protein [Vibrio halioticoli]GAD89949.1 hypothetical protein VHA01S_030_00240 [Vibrio halioticoli NBRC 102217]
MMMLLKIFLTVFLVQVIAFHSLANETASEQIKAAVKVASKPKKLLHSNAVVLFANSGESVVVSDNPRWVIKGQLFDMWSNVEVNGTAQLEALERKLPLDKLNVNTKDVFDFIVNPSKSQTVTIFIDPFEENTSHVVSVLSKYATDYRLRFILTAVEASHINPFIALQCAHQKVNDAVILDQLITQNFSDAKASCDQTKAMNSYGLSAFLQIKTSPTLVAPNSELSVGMPSQLMTWLAKNSN